MLASLVLLQLKKGKLSGACLAQGGEIEMRVLRAVFRWSWHQSDRHRERFQ